MIRLTGVSKTFDGGRTYAIRKITLEIERGETLVLLGSSGSGKSTTLKTINRLIDLAVERFDDQCQSERSFDVDADA